MHEKTSQTRKMRQNIPQRVAIKTEALVSAMIVTTSFEGHPTARAPKLIGLWATGHRFCRNSTPYSRR